MNHVRPDKQLVIREVSDAGFQLIDEPKESMSGQYILQFRKSAEPKSGAAHRKIFPYHAVQETLPNGLKAIVIPLDSPGLVTYWSIVRTGSRDEVEPGRSGFAHFFEHMMFRGTKKYPGPVYDDIVTSLGAGQQRLHHRRLHGLPPDVRQGGPGAGRSKSKATASRTCHYEKPAFQTEAGAVYGEYRKGITQPVLRCWTRSCTTWPTTCTPTSTPRSASRRTSRPCPKRTSTASRSSAASIGRRTWCC